MYLLFEALLQICVLQTQEFWYWCWARQDTYKPQYNFSTNIIHTSDHRTQKYIMLTQTEVLPIPRSPQPHPKFAHSPFNTTLEVKVSDKGKWSWNSGLNQLLLKYLTFANFNQNIWSCKDILQPLSGSWDGSCKWRS